MTPRNFFKYLLSAILFFVPIVFWAQTNTAPTLTASGDQYYCPQSQMNVVTDFNVVDPDDNEIEAVYVQISTGYVNGEDELTLTGSHPNIATTWSVSEGKLTLESSTGGNALYVDLIAAVKEVIFESSNTNPTIDKSFSITIGDANYLPSTEHFYEYIPNNGITWTSAKTAAEGRDYFGLQGYLATITSPEEAQLSGEQAEGQGWLGGSDEETEGTWKWVTGPEAGDTFWFGLANGNSNGADHTYTNWSAGEPNDWPNPGIPSEENYLHVYSDGNWNDYPNNNNNIQGYIVEYGGTPGDPILNISASTTIKMAKITATTPDTSCGTGQVTLSATSNTGFVLWFDSSNGGTKLASGNTFSPTISATNTYYALASSDGVCENGPRTPVTATFYSIPTITSTTDTIICESGTGTLTATASVGTINWYNSATGGVSIASGTSFTTPNITSTTIYYVDATENGCTTTTRTPVTATIQDTSTPTGNTTQTFCDIENATISNLTVVGNTIQWYANSSGGTPLNATDLLTSATNYYATQTINGCESPSRLAVNVLVFETVIPSTTNILLEECDNSSDGDDTNGFTFFDLTSKEIELLNGKNLLDFTIKYFKEDTYLISSEITDPSNFQNTSINGQTVYARIFNNLDTTCFTDTSFEIQVNTLPVIQSTIVFKNCDEDGTSDGFTDFNLEEADPFITNNNQDIVTYYLTYAEADNSSSTALSSPFNNQDAVNNEVFARVENSFGCHRVATVNLDVSATKLPAGFNYQMESCDQDDIIDGKAVFNLTEATQYYINTLPPQNLSVHYYRNLLDAQLEQNEILTPTNYENEIPFSQTLYVRVENDDNGACFGIGEHLTLIVHPRPEFEVNPEAMVCLNLPPITLQIFNPNGIYTYKWTDELNSVISNQPTAFVSKGGVYTVVATSTAECASFERTVNVSESKIASITLNDIAVTDDSNNNSITINTLNLGIGDYEFAMDDIDGLYQNEPVFSNVAPGIRTIYVRDKNNCGIASIEVSVIGFPKFLTPNNDGYNDRWSILGATDEFYESAQIMIFNRFGKYITTIDSTKDAGWNGSYNGVILTASDYWFKAKLTDKKGNVREKSGHFSLITH